MLLLAELGHPMQPCFASQLNCGKDRRGTCHIVATPCLSFSFCILSWFFSPVLTGAAAALIFFLVRTFVMRRRNARNLVFWVLPIAVLITVFINIFFVL